VTIKVKIKKQIKVKIKVKIKKVNPQQLIEKELTHAKFLRTNKIKTLHHEKIFLQELKLSLIPKNSQKQSHLRIIFQQKKRRQSIKQTKKV
jgi:hypothetical protein